MAHPNIEYANMAHPNMEDAHVAPLNRPDDDFPDTNIMIIMSKNMGVAYFGSKIHQNGETRIAFRMPRAARAQIKGSRAQNPEQKKDGVLEVSILIIYLA